MLRFMGCLSPETEDLIIRASIFRMPSHLLGKPHVCCSASIQALSQSLEGQPGSSGNVCLYLPSGFQCYLGELRGEFANISHSSDSHGRQQFVNCQKHLSKEALIPWIHLFHDAQVPFLFLNAEPQASNENSKAINQLFSPVKQLFCVIHLQTVETAFSEATYHTNMYVFVLG